MTYSFSNPSDGLIRQYFKTSRVIAVVGLSERREAVSHRVSRDMQKRGFRIVPVNPKAVGKKILEEEVYARLQDIPFSVDIVNVYRRNDYLPDVARDFLETTARIFWAQLGLENQEAAQLLQAQGCKDIVMNRCIKQEYTRLLLEKD